MRTEVADTDPTGEAGVAGGATAVVEAVERLADAGAHTVILQPIAGEPDPEGFVRVAAG